MKYVIDNNSLSWYLGFLVLEPFRDAAAVVTTSGAMTLLPEPDAVAFEEDLLVRAILSYNLFHGTVQWQKMEARAKVGHESELMKVERVLQVLAPTH